MLKTKLYRKVTYGFAHVTNTEWSWYEYIRSRVSFHYCKHVGILDEEMIPYLERMNKLKGIYTLYCCVGHTDSWEGAQGYIWFKSRYDTDMIYEILEEIEDKFSDICTLDHNEEGVLAIHWLAGFYYEIMEELCHRLEVYHS